MSKSDADGLPPVSTQTADLRAVLEEIDNCSDPAQKAKLVATRLQPKVGYLLRTVISNARSEGVTWMKVGEVTETSYTALCRQFYGSGPMLSAASRAHHRKADQ